MDSRAPRQRHRSWPRINVRWDAWWSPSPDRPELATVRDISAQGAFLEPRTSSRVAIGQRLTLRLKSPDGGLDLSCDATVRWVGASLAHGADGFGVEFTEILETIDRYIAART